MRHLPLPWLGGSSAGGRTSQVSSTDLNSVACHPACGWVVLSALPGAAMYHVLLYVAKLYWKYPDCVPINIFWTTASILQRGQMTMETDRYQCNICYIGMLGSHV